MLLVDDEEDILESLALLLAEEQDITVRRARNGLEALDLLAREEADLVITDYRMPRMDGLKLIEAVSRLHPGTAAILVTAYPDPGLEEAAARLPAFVGFLPKPFEPQALLERVSAVLSARSA